MKCRDCKYGLDCAVRVIKVFQGDDETCKDYTRRRLIEVKNEVMGL